MAPLRDARTQHPTTPLGTADSAWSPWPDGKPRLRPDSRTAKQLSYLTPEAMHLETRRIFIGDFPSGWIEQNCSEWLAAVRKGMPPADDKSDEPGKPALAKLTSLTGSTPSSSVKDTSNSTEPSADDASDTTIATSPEPALTSLVPQTQGAALDDITAHKPHNGSHIGSHMAASGILTNHELPRLSIRELKSGSSRRVHSEPPMLSTLAKSGGDAGADMTVALATEVAKASLTTAKSHKSRSKTIAHKIRRRRAKWRKEKLADVPMQLVDGSPAATSTTNTQKQLPPISEESIKDTSGDGGKTIPVKEAESLSLSSTLRSEGTMYYDCGEPEPDVKSMPDQDPSPEPEAPEPISPHGLASLRSASSLPDHRMLPKAFKKPAVAIAESPAVALISPTNTVTSISESTDSGTLKQTTSEISASSKRMRKHLRFNTHRQRKLIYQGHFLVQTRETSLEPPIINETEAPLATSLATRWKEYAIFAKYTGNPEQPLTIYFYQAVEDSKLTRRAQRSWSRSLDFKIAVDGTYKLGIFSPLDLTLALWKPHIPRNKDRHPAHRHRSHRTKITIIHSQSSHSTMEMAFLLASVVHTTEMFSKRLVSVGVPSMELSVRLRIGDKPFKMHPASIAGQPDITYEELCSPLSSTSPAIKYLINTVWSSVGSLSRRNQVSDAPDRFQGSKFSLAWQVSPISNRQLWVPESACEVSFLSRLLWLMEPYGKLYLLNPRPKCYEGDLVEPPGVEGFCVGVNTGKNIQSVNFVGKSGRHYLHTHDNFLFYSHTTRSVPPMLASGQSTLEKTVDPFPLDSEGNVRWIIESTCMREIDYHDSIAGRELERQITMVADARGFIDLKRVKSVVNHGSEVSIMSEREDRCLYKIQFASHQEAKSWEERLNDLIHYWKSVHSAETLRRVTVTANPAGITPYLMNRTILYAGLIFMKKHRFSTFKRVHVVLTLQGLTVFKVADTNREAKLAKVTVPVSSYNFRNYMKVELQDSYAYTGQLAKHALLNDDKHIDHSNPGVRALPRAYAHGWISQDTELDRCFVIWHSHQSILDKVLSNAGSGSYAAFLARDKQDRDNWVTAIRYVQTELASRRGDPGLMNESAGTNNDSGYETDSSSVIS